MPRRRLRLGRFLLNALTALSLLLCVGAVGLWVRSYFVGDYVYRVGVTPFTGSDSKSIQFMPPTVWVRRVEATCVWGRIGWSSRRGHARLAQPTEGWEWVANDPHRRVVCLWGVMPVCSFRGDDGSWCVAGGGYAFASRPDGRWSRAFECPLWWPALAAGVLPSVRAGRAWRRRRHATAGHAQCPRCRHDLTGNASGTCPECGSPVAAAAGVAPAAGAGRKPDA